MKEILLTQGQTALVDDEDYEILCQYKWYAYKNRNTYYARRALPRNGRKHQININMHHEILQRKNGLVTDHINGNGLDNRRENLRLVTHQQNCCNQKAPYGSSKYKGVGWEPRKRHWFARICIDGKKIYLGSSKVEEEAAKIYDRAALKYHGEFAALNFGGK